MQDFNEIVDETLIDVAKKMLIAAKTAPKARGEDNMVMKIVYKDGIKMLSDKLKELGVKYDVAGFLRDSENILSASVMILMGTKIKAVGLKKCGLCGLENCEGKNKHENIPCVFNTGDLGIAMGSAVGIASDYHVDNRIMYSVGIAVLEAGLLEKDVKIVYAIPLSAWPKNPFFDRKQ